VQAVLARPFLHDAALPVRAAEAAVSIVSAFLSLHGANRVTWGAASSAFTSCAALVISPVHID
jgi:hypothetical protein